LNKIVSGNPGLLWDRNSTFNIASSSKWVFGAYVMEKTGGVPVGDVLVELHGQASTHGIREHIEAMKAFVASTGGAPVQVKSHPIGFGSGDWTCVVGELENGSRMVTLAKWRDGAIVEEHIWL